MRWQAAGRVGHSDRQVQPKGRAALGESNPPPSVYPRTQGTRSRASRGGCSGRLSPPAALESWLRGSDAPAAGLQKGVGMWGRGRSEGSSEVTPAGEPRDPLQSRLTALTSLTSCTSCVPAGAEDTGLRWGQARKGWPTMDRGSLVLSESRRQRGRGDSLGCGAGGGVQKKPHRLNSGPHASRRCEPNLAGLQGGSWR